MTKSPDQLRLADEPLEPLLLLLEAAGASAKLELQTPDGMGVLEIRGGRLESAEFGSTSGLSAAHRLLLAKTGTYGIDYEAKPGSVTTPLNASLSSLLREDNRYGEHGVAPPVQAPLERTSEPLPSGLSAAELRCLSAIGNGEALLAVVTKVKDNPDELLRAARGLLDKELIRQSTTRTLHLGTPVPDPRNTVSPDGEEDESNPANPQPIARLKPLKRSIPIHMARGARNQLSGRYSSAPPAALAEDQVSVPNNVIQPRIFQSTAPDAEDEPDASSEHALHQEELEGGTPVRSAKTLPSTPPSMNLDELDSPLSEEDFEAPQIEGDWTYRRPMHTIDDDLIRAAARGQLTDSEMPVPSSHLGKATLEQLGQLDQAIASSRVPNFPPSSANFDDEIPGSVPGSQALPGKTLFNPESGLPTVGRYEVLARLKSGGMGSVYMCRLSGAAGFRRLFAMKVLHGHLADEPETLDAFFHEARVLAGLHHPNVVGVVDVGTPQEPYIVLDYVEGGSLLELFRASRPDESTAPVITVILDALAGLQAAHSTVDEDGKPLGLIHCDITPHNLLVGVDGTCRVTDFGIARTGGTQNNGAVTRGKPGYVAPERIRRLPADHRSDLFSMGVVLYAGLTGEEPFYAASQEETMHNVLKRRVPPPSEVGRRPPPCLDWICAKALARDPEDRFQSAEEMAQQLQRIATREGLLATPSEVAQWVKASLAPTLAARRAASQRGTIPPSRRGAGHQSSIPQSNVDSSSRQGSGMVSRLPQLASAPPAMPPSSSGRDTDAPQSRPDSDNTEILDSLVPSGSQILKRLFLGVILMAFLGMLAYVVLFPQAVGDWLRGGASNNPPAPPVGLEEQRPSPPVAGPGAVPPPSEDQVEDSPSSAHPTVELPDITEK